MCMKLALELISSNFLERGLCKEIAFLRCVGKYIVTPLVFPWSEGCSLGTMVLIIFFERSSHYGQSFH